MVILFSKMKNFPFFMVVLLLWVGNVISHDSTKPRKVNILSRVVKNENSNVVDITAKTILEEKHSPSHRFLRGGSWSSGGSSSSSWSSGGSSSGWGRNNNYNNNYNNNNYNRRRNGFGFGSILGGLALAGIGLALLAVVAPGAAAATCACCPCLLAACCGAGLAQAASNNANGNNGYNSYANMGTGGSKVGGAGSYNAHPPTYNEIASSSFNNAVQQAKYEVESLAPNPASPPQVVQPYSGQYTTSFIDPESNVTHNASLCLFFARQGQFFRITGQGSDIDGNTVVEEGMVRASDGLAWWRERTITGDIGLEVLSKGRFDFQTRTFQGTWLASSMISGPYLSFMALQPPQQQQPQYNNATNATTNAYGNNKYNTIPVATAEVVEPYNPYAQQPSTNPNYTASSSSPPVVMGQAL